MIVSIHQPHFMPWLGYLDRMMRSDLFILLDHVQFERRNYQNRTMIRVEDESRWLTVPVVQLSQKERIVEKRVDNPLPGVERWWGPHHYLTLKFAYRNAHYFNTYAPAVKEILETRWEKLVDLDLATLELLRAAFSISTPMLRSSTLKVDGYRSGLLLNLCKEVGATTLLAGMGGSRDYLDVDAFERAGVAVAWQKFEHPRYPQCGSSRFIPGLSSLDLLFNCGPAGLGLLGGREGPVDERLAA